MAKCPKCKEEVRLPKKEWDYGPKDDPKRFRVQYFRCSQRHGFMIWNRAKR